MSKQVVTPTHRFSGFHFMKGTQVFGFTLIELLVVISILAILMGILSPYLMGSRNKAKMMALKSINDGLAKDPRVKVHFLFDESSAENKATGGVAGSAATGDLDEVMNWAMSGEGILSGATWRKNGGRFESQDSLQLNTRAGNLTYPMPDSLNGQSGLSVLVWVKFDEVLDPLAIKKATILRMGSGSTTLLELRTVSDGTNFFAMSKENKVIGGKPEPGRWYGIGVVIKANSVEGMNMKLFIDGIEVTSSANALEKKLCTSNKSHLVIGSDYDTNSTTKGMVGYIDQVTIFNEAVDPGEIKAWYEAGVPD